MKEIRNIQELGQFINDYERLQRISKSLQKLNKIQNLTTVQEKRRAKLLEEAIQIAAKYELSIKYNNDPKDYPLYLIDSENHT